MKNTATFIINDPGDFKIRMLNWTNQFGIFCLLDNQQYQQGNPAFDCLLAAGCKYNIQLNAGKAFEQLKAFSDQHPGWLFGHFGYDLKNETEKLESKNFDAVNFPDAHFFVPFHVLQLTGEKLIVFSDDDPRLIFSAISGCASGIISSSHSSIQVSSRLSHRQYVDAVKNMKAHILRGDCYEINFCQEFYADDAVIDPVQVYKSLTAISPMPFSALYKLNDKFCICASPERYLKRSGHRVLSQPIKGTAKRNLLDSDCDRKIKNELLRNEKEKSENVMVVDLVRNDLSKICKKGSVRVDELFGLYSFPQVHQMISTVSGELKNDLHWVDMIKATFPMGSMTGAPKKKVMELVEKYEFTKRGLYSGAIGYVRPDGDFDFNVVIRSILYNSATRYISFHTGSAITFYCDAEKEYEECELKATAIKNVLEQIVIENSCTAHANNIDKITNGY